MIQLPTTLRILGLIGKPSRILPQIKVDDIRQLNFPALKALGYRGVVFDKDNCITKPGVDTLLPHLQDSWNSCVSTFGPSKVLIVSNSSGTKSDAGCLGAEALHASTGVPVLLHAKKKPFCHQEVSDYFTLSLTTPLTSTGRLLAPSASSPPPPPPATSTSTPPPSSPELASSSPSPSSSTTALIPTSTLTPVPGSLGILVIGDRLLTDTLLTTLLPRSPPSISILTTLLSQPKDVRFLRLLERALERLVRRSTGIDHQVEMKRWREVGAVKMVPEVEKGVGLVERVGGWVESGRRVGRGVRGGLEVVGRGVRKVGRGVKWVGEKVGLAGGGGEKAGSSVGGEKVLEVESVLGAGKGGVEGVKKVEEVVGQAKKEVV